MKIIWIYLLIVFGLITSITCRAEPIRAGVLENGFPYASHKNNVYKGMVVDLWEAIADHEKLQFVYIPIPESETTSQAIKELEAGKYDILIGGIAVTYDRIQKIDFTQPYFINRIGVVETKKRADFLQIMYVLKEVILSPFVIGFLIYFVIYVHLLWLFEKETNPEVPNNYAEGMSFILWQHMKQSSNWNLPRSTPGRIGAFSWLITSRLMITSVIAAVTSKLTLILALHVGQYSRPTDLEEKKVATIRGSYDAEIVRKIGATIVSIDRFQDGFKLLHDKQIDAVVGNYVQMKAALAASNYRDLQVADFAVANTVYAFPLRQNSPFRERINAGILFLQEKDFATSICAKSIGEKDAKNCSF